MKRRILCLISVLAVLSALFINYGAAAVNADTQTAVEMLDAFGFISADEISENYITREEFVNYASKLVSPNDTWLSGSERLFADVSLESPFYGVINSFARLNIISSGKYIYFRPTENITLAEAAKILVNIMGYGVKAETKGGFPSGYMAVSAEMGLTKGISVGFNSPIKLNELRTLFVNIIESRAEMPSDIRYGEEGTDIYFGGGKTYIEQVFNIYKITGVLTDDSYRSIYGGKTSLNGRIKIDNTEFLCDKIVSEYLGLSITAYYRKDDDTADKAIVYIMPGANKNTVLTIADEYIADFSNGVYKYYTDDKKEKEHTFKLSGSASVIYNGRAVTSSVGYTDSVMKPTHGQVTLIDNDNDNAADICFVDSYKNFIIGSLDLKNETIYSQGGGFKVDLSQLSDDYDIYDSYLVKQTFRALEREQVISVGESLSKDYYKIIFSSKTINGSVTEQDSDGNLIINGEKHKIISEMTNPPKVGDTGVFRLTFDGRIANFTRGDGEFWQYAYLCGANVKSAIDVSAKLQLYTQENKLIVAETRLPLIIDGNSYKTPEAVVAALSEDSEVKRQLVKVKLNDDFKVTEIDTAAKGANENDDSLYQMHKDLGACTFNGIGGVIAYGNKSYGVVSEKTIGFRIPDPFNTDHLECVDWKTLGDGSITYGSVKFSIFGEKQGTVNASAVTYQVRYSGLDLSYDDFLYTSPYVVSKVTTVVNDEGSPCKRLYVYDKNGVETSYLTENENTLKYTRNTKIYEVGTGDVIRFGYDKNKLIGARNFHLLYGASDGGWLNTSAYGVGANFLDPLSVNGATITAFDQNAMILDFMHTPTDDKYALPYDKFLTYYIYDSKTNKLTQTTYSELSSVKDAGTDAPRVVYVCVDYSYHFLIIYR